MEHPFRSVARYGHTVLQKYSHSGDGFVVFQALASHHLPHLIGTMVLALHTILPSHPTMSDDMDAAQYQVHFDAWVDLVKLYPEGIFHTKAEFDLWFIEGLPPHLHNTVMQQHTQLLGLVAAAQGLQCDEAPDYDPDLSWTNLVCILGLHTHWSDPSFGRTKTSSKQTPVLGGIANIDVSSSAVSVIAVDVEDDEVVWALSDVASNTVAAFHPCHHPNPPVFTAPVMSFSSMHGSQASSRTLLCVFPATYG